MEKEWLWKVQGQRIRSTQEQNKKLPNTDTAEQEIRNYSIFINVLFHSLRFCSMLSDIANSNFQIVLLICVYYLLFYRIKALLTYVKLAYDL